MKRRDFFEKSVIAGGLIGPAAAMSSFDSAGEGGNLPNNWAGEELVIERPASGRPHEGKVLAVIQPHCDDIAYFAAGTVAKLMHEGYTGYLIRTTNDDAAAPEKYGEVVLNNEISNEAFAKVMGFKRCMILATGTTGWMNTNTGDKRTAHLPVQAAEGGYHSELRPVGSL